MSNSPLKSSEQSAAVQKMIDEITTFSSVRMFGHLFDVTSSQVSTFAHIEQQCQQILSSQLQGDLLSGTGETEGAEDLIRQSALEASLSRIFSGYSDFWEQYYRRINRRNHSTEPAPCPCDATDSMFQSAARVRYPHFFVLLDVMQYADQKHGEAYQLIQMSLQAYLKGLLLSACERIDEMREAMAQALKLIGPLHAPDFRKVLVSVLEM